MRRDRESGVAGIAIGRVDLEFARELPHCSVMVHCSWRDSIPIEIDTSKAVVNTGWFWIKEKNMSAL